MHRMLTLIRTGTDFGPFPSDPRVTTIQSDFIQFQTQNEEVVTISWDRNTQRLLYEIDGQPAVELLDGVVGTTSAEGVLQAPFTLSYEKGRRLYRATIDLTVALRNGRLGKGVQPRTSRGDVTTATPGYA